VTTMPWEQAPHGWLRPDDQVLDDALSRTLNALSVGGEHPVEMRLVAYYDRAKDYAGADFAELLPIEDQDITSTDLFAVSLLSMRFKASATRRLLDHGGHRLDVLSKLRALPDKELLVADPDALTAMDAFYLAVKAAVVDPKAKHSDPWVTASKICARKRPDLFPVRDKQVREYLGLRRFGDYQFDWLVYRHLLGCNEVIGALEVAASVTTALGADRELRLEKSTLRVMDAALWTYTAWYPDELKKMTAAGKNQGAGLRR
jgi:Family of unknown function (DUF6308)